VPNVFRAREASGPNGRLFAYHEAMMLDMKEEGSLTKGRPQK